MNEMIYILMINLFSAGWVIAPAEGNPYPTLRACTTVRNIVLKRHVYMVDDNNVFRGVRCVPRKKDYLYLHLHW